MLDKSLPKILADNCFSRVPANEKVWALGPDVICSFAGIRDGSGWWDYFKLAGGA